VDSPERFRKSVDMRYSQVSIKLDQLEGTNSKEKQATNNSKSKVTFLIRSG
jgi:hypothetical protein